MRITREVLQKTAKDTVNARLRSEKDLIAAYLVGSALSDDPLLGGVTDIDIVLVHSGEKVKGRELLRVNDDIHLDIQHLPQKLFQQPRALRGDPWIGSSVQANPMLLYDVRHWFEFTQASVGSQFNRADNVILRARTLSEDSRNSWKKLVELKRPHVERVRLYLKSLYNAGNAIACLAGVPITKRRFGMEIEEVMISAGEPEMFTGLSALCQMNGIEKDDLVDLMPYWEKAFILSCHQEKHSEDIQPVSKDYYLRSFQYLLDKDMTEAVVFPFLQTWTKSICSLISTTPEHEIWTRTMSAIHLGREEFDDRIQGLDAYLDQLDEVLDNWAAKNGA